MQSKKNIIPGKTKTLNFYFFIFLFLLFNNQSTANDISFVEIKILDKVSSKNSNITLEIGKEIKFKNLIIKSLKCVNSKFDDNPEITTYLQVRDINNKNNDEVFVFNGWFFSSSPSLRPFDHPVYDIWVIGCF